MLQFAMRDRLINQYWKFRRYYWKYKFVIRKVLIKAYEAILSIRLPFGKARSTMYWKAYSQITSTGASAYWNFRKVYDISRLFVIRSFWKIKGAVNYVIGYSLGYFRHFSVRGYWKLRRSADRLNEAGSGMILQMKKTKVIFHPFKKSFWFLSYQAQKRIFPIFRKKTKSD